MSEPTDPKYQAIWQLFTRALYADLREEDDFDKVKPFLAHYTSLDALEKILRSNEIWFSNPLLMNDLEEVRFGILHGADRLRTNKAITDALANENRVRRFQEAFEHIFRLFSEQNSLDTYVFCLSEHDRSDHDGILSMWRGYGGNGRGAAIVFDTSQLGPAVQGGDSLILAKVHYGTADERLAWIEEKLATLAGLIEANKVPDDMLHLPAFAIFQRIKLFALFSKHSGFKEEREWRVVYQRENDPENKLSANFGYLNGPRGIEPKLLFEVKPIVGFTVPDFSLEKIVSSIILGPTASSPLALASAKRMVEVVRPTLVDRVFASAIPFRPT